MENWTDIKKERDTADFIAFWRENGAEIFYIDDFPWMKYQNILQPFVLPGPYQLPEFSDREIKALLKKSGLRIARWPGKTTGRPAAWWWVICRPPFSTGLLSHNARNQIKKALKGCVIKLVDVSWLVDNGYDCYLASSKAHKKALFLSLEQWRKFIGSHSKYGCFDFWGIFFEGKLIGYAKCVKLDKRADISAIWYDPDYRKHYPVYALVYTLLDHYLCARQYDYVSNGMRSIGHDTQMQDFLETKFNFKKEYCALNVVYDPLFGVLVRFAYPFGFIVRLMRKVFPISAFDKIDIVLSQEKIRISF